MSYKFKISSMKKIYFIVISGLLVSTLILIACKKSYLELNPIGVLDEQVLANEKGVNALLIGAYSQLDGYPTPADARIWNGAIDNWVFSLAGDDTYKGSEFGDEAFMQNIENYTADPINVAFKDKWATLYDGVARSNSVLRLLEKVNEPTFTVDEAKQIKAEAYFLRAVYHFEAAKLWRNVPYMTEANTFESGNYLVSNTDPVWPKIEADFKFAVENLTTTKPQTGRANSWAAKAFLAKVYMFQSKFTEAKALLDDIIANGNNTKGVKYNLMPKFFDNFDALKKNNLETVFSVQMSVKDGSGGLNGNYPIILNFAWGGGPSRCCGFNQPSQTLVNAFQVNVNGLPLISTFNNTNVKSDLGLKNADPFTPHTGTLDPRIDYTVGRRGIPYLDWGIMTGSSWIRKQSDGGSYLGIKYVVPKAQQGITSDASAGWQAGAGSAINYNMIRFADVLLWAAEVEVEIGSLAKAEEYVNRVRGRAANPAGWVYTYIDNTNPSLGFTNIPAANYKISPYTGQFTAQGKDFAREAVRFERRLEFGQEGHRFFDLQRWDKGTGYMADQLNAHITATVNYFKSVLVNGVPLKYTTLEGATFKKGKTEIFPIPQSQIDLSVKDGQSVLKQNPGYQ